MALHHRLIGKVAGFYWRLRRPLTLGVRAIVVDNAGRIALVRHTYADQWYLPGGAVKRGESFEAALHRELREEIALDCCVIGRVLGVYHSRREGKDDHIVIFVVHAGEGVPSLSRADPMEIEEAGWFSPDALPETLSPATKRRVAEYLAGIAGIGAW